MNVVQVCLCCMQYDSIVEYLFQVFLSAAQFSKILVFPNMGKLFWLIIGYYSNFFGLYFDLHEPPHICLSLFPLMVCTIRF